jgi:transposase InsO family protein
MPWREVSVMEERREFVRLAMLEGANRRELCRRFGISADVAYKWLGRWASGDEALQDRSRRPQTSPGRSSTKLEAAVLAVRDAHPAWGARKIEYCIAQRGIEPPAVSTIHAILHRHGRIGAAPGPGKAYERFERAQPNELWQMDFKGWVKLADGAVCHPLTVIDDHSRYVPCLKACADQTGRTVKAHLEKCLRKNGLPDAIFVDNGNPWSDSGGERWTKFEVWLLKLGIGLVRSRPYHPQSRGKNERFHRTLKAEVFELRSIKNMAHAQRVFDHWLDVYNHERPHEALGQNPPSTRYRPSPRPMPGKLSQPEYDEADIVRTVFATTPYIAFQGRRIKVPKAFCGERLAIRPLDRDGCYGLFFASHHIADINLTKGRKCQ